MLTPIVLQMGISQALEAVDQMLMRVADDKLANIPGAEPIRKELFQDALTKQDYPLLQGAFLLLAISVIIANMIADALYVVLDPRVKAS